MSKTPFLFKSFAFKVTVIIIVALSLSSGLSDFLIHRFDTLREYEQIRRDLDIFAATCSLMIDVEILLRIPLNQEAVYTQEYASIASKLEKIEESNPKISYLYIIVPSRKLGEWQYLVLSPAKREAEERTANVYPGARYDMPDFSKKEINPAARPVLSGYGPIRDKQGQVVAFLGIDVYKKDIAYARSRGGSGRFVLLSSLIILVSFFIGLFVSRRITHPIVQLIEGTRLIGKGDFNYKVNVKGNDEIAELGHSFNEMAINLSESKKALNEYFYRVVQSLVSSLEAKDSYTRGHSDRVSDYAAEIAIKIGLPKEKAELLRKAAQLHDIGKIGINENILNKTEKLTDEEWSLIRGHPVTGEEILRPVFLDKEMLAAVRWHHERYDGKGYPDGKDGDNINIFAQIISVADAYDAMTSVRSYRPAMTHEEAVRRLKDASGTQLNPRIVDVFLKILEGKLKSS